MGPSGPRAAICLKPELSQKFQVNQVIPGCKDHQHQHKSESDTEADFLRAFAQWPSPDGFDAVEQKMSSIEHRYREQIQQPNTDGDDRGKVEQRDKACGCHLT